MQWPRVVIFAMAPPQVKFHTHEYDYKGCNLASTAVTLYHYDSEVGYVSIIQVYIMYKQKVHTHKYDYKGHNPASTAVSYMVP